MDDPVAGFFALGPFLVAPDFARFFDAPGVVFLAVFGVVLPLVEAAALAAALFLK